MVVFKYYLFTWFITQNIMWWADILFRCNKTQTQTWPVKIANRPTRLNKTHQASVRIVLVPEIMNVLWTGEFYQAKAGNSN